MPCDTPITVLGVGNPIMSDDAVGLALLERLEQQRPDQRIEYVDGGTGGLELLPVVQDAQRLLILDAVRGANPGEVVRLSGDQLPRLLASRLSPHEVGLADVFAAARLLGREPAEIEIVGIVPQEVAAGLDLSPSVAASLDNAVASAVSVIDSWLHAPHPAVV